MDDAFSIKQLKRHGLRFELARLLLQHGAGPIEVARETGLTVEQVDQVRTSVNAKRREELCL